MRDVVNRLHANVCYLIMDDLREEELYTQAPVKVSFPEEENHLDFSLTVRTLNRKQVRLSDFSTDATGITLTANLGDTIQSPVGKIVVSPTLYIQTSGSTHRLRYAGRVRTQWPAYSEAT